MTKLLAGFGFIILLTTLCFAGKSLGKSEGPEFQEAEVVKAGEVKYPVNSVAYGIVVLEMTIDVEGKIEALKVAGRKP